jgi:hypothetical protein
MVEDLAGQMAEELPADESGQMVALLGERKIRFVTYSDWQLLDKIEKERGEADGRIRQKFTEVSEMLAALRDA